MSACEYLLVALASSCIAGIAGYRCGLKHGEKAGHKSGIDALRRQMIRKMQMCKESAEDREPWTLKILHLAELEAAD
jgi:high-affinity nickel permease